MLGLGVRQQRRRKDVRRAGWVMAMRDVIDRRVRAVVAVMAVLIVAGTAAVHGATGLTWFQSLYLAMGAVTSAGIEDDSFVAAKPWLKVVTAGVQLVGIILVALLTAVIVDSLIGARLSRVLGGVRGRPSDHVIVCGLGTVGARVLELLTERGVAVVGVEHSEAAPGVLTAHRLRIPVVIGDSSNEEILRSAGVQRCQAVIAITDGDITNLESAIIARELNKGARIVMRMFDHDLAQRVEEQLNLGQEPFGVHAGGPGRRCRGRRPAGADHRSGRSAGAAADRGHRRARLGGGRSPTGGVGGVPQPPDPGALPGQGRWNWTFRPETAVSVHDRLAVAGTRSGLARLLLATRSMRRRGLSERMDP